MRALSLLLAVAFGWLLLAGCPPRRPWSGVTPQEFGRLNEHRLLGMAFLENLQYLEALREFDALRRARPALPLGHQNAGVTLLKLPNRLQEALAAAEEAARRAPDSALPHLLIARVHQLAGRTEEATRALETAVRKEPNNPRVLGALALHLRNVPGDTSARQYELRRRIAELAPENLEAQAAWLEAQVARGEYDGALRTLERIERILPRMPVEAREHVAQLRRDLAARSPRALRSAQIFVRILPTSPVYSAARNALYGNEQDPADLAFHDWHYPPPPLPEPPLPEARIVWRERTSETGLAGVAVRGLAPVATGDVEPAPGAGRRTGGTVEPILGLPDLVLGPSWAQVRVNDGNAFAPPASSGPPAAAPVSLLLADLNNDFTLDLYAAGPEGDRLLPNPRAGTDEPAGITFAPRPARPVALPGPRGPGVPLAVDLDQDGDLDIVRPSAAPGEPAVRYLRNNGNLSFTDLTASAGLRVPSRGARQAVFADFDNDGDPDLFVAQSDGPPLLFENRRQDVFVERAAEWGLRPPTAGAAGYMAAAVLDIEADGDWDLAVAARAPGGSLLYRNEGERFAAEPLPLPADFQAEWIAVLDYDNDARQDLVVAGSGGLRLLRNEGGRFADAGAPLAEPAAWVRPVDIDRDGDLDLLAVDRAGRLRLLANDGGNTRPWLRVELQGLVPRTGTGNTQANNSYAIGAVLQPQTVWSQQRLLVTEPQTHIGLGNANRVVSLRVVWTHGVPQHAIGPQTGQPIHFVQTPQGSCPFLYTWDGERWRFACDFNWRSPLGMLVARGVPIPHDMTLDWVKLPGEQLRPVAGHYRLIATEELREISYFDMIRLLAVDHPAETEVYVDERFPMGPPPPFRIYTATRRRRPVAARNDAGENLLPALAAVDNVYTPVPPGPYRGVRRPHDLILDLGDVPDPDDVRLFLHGWIYPAGTSVNIAASQNPAAPVIPPILYVGDGRGGWVEVDRTVGLPTGKRKTIVLDLSRRFRRGPRGYDFRVKLRTTMEIRWDAAFFTSGEPPVRIVRTEAPLAEAELRERGYGRRYREVAEGPDLFDYERPLPAGQPGWPDLSGAFTRLGDCTPLLRRVDDHYVIMAPGDELRLAFDGRRLPPLPPGWKRDFILLSDGWTKDSDPNTLTGETVEPLPFHGMKRYPYGPDERFPDTPAHRRWMREWNTRIKIGPASERAEARSQQRGSLGRRAGRRLDRGPVRPAG